jgi:hypothetical protein
MAVNGRMLVPVQMTARSFSEMLIDAAHPKVRVQEEQYFPNR